MLETENDGILKIVNLNDAWAASYAGDRYAN